MRPSLFIFVQLFCKGRALKQYRARICQGLWSSELVFVKLLRSPEIDSQPVGPVQQPFSSYRTARLHRLAESIPWFLKRFQIRLRTIPPGWESIPRLHKRFIYKYGLSVHQAVVLKREKLRAHYTVK